MVGRKREIELLNGLIASPKAEFVAIYGRRRIGKTYLVKNVYARHFAFDFTGTQNATMRNQLAKFSVKIAECFGRPPETRPPQSWHEAFHLLKTCIGQLPSDQKQVVFFDELPWIAITCRKYRRAKRLFRPLIGYFLPPTGLCAANSTTCMQRFLSNTKTTSG
jgi:uncharacterized protein